MFCMQVEDTPRQFNFSAPVSCIMWFCFFLLKYNNSYSLRTKKWDLDSPGRVGGGGRVMSGMLF